MIQIDSLSKTFRSGRGKKATEVHAVRAVSFTAQEGRITGLLGPNGAGKTTTLRMVAGLIQPDSGTALVDGISIATDRSKAMKRLGVLSDARGLYGRLTARENIAYYGSLYGLSKAQSHQAIDRMADMLEMATLLDRRTEGFSQGERMKVALARAMIHNPANLILDEPTNGLDVLSTRALRESLRTLRDETGKSIIFSTHVMQEVERLCDHVVVVAQGRCVAEGTIEALKSQAGTDDFEEAFVRLAFPDRSESA
ncbi:MAG: sodium transporter ATP-binding protein NatA [Pseudomonadota bacterium]|jgi:sodium transport system ATP-binding protein